MQIVRVWGCVLTFLLFLQIGSILVEEISEQMILVFMNRLIWFHDSVVFVSDLHKTIHKTNAVEDLFTLYISIDSNHFKDLRLKLKKLFSYRYEWDEHKSTNTLKTFIGLGRRLLYYITFVSIMTLLYMYLMG